MAEILQDKHAAAVSLLGNMTERVAELDAENARLREAIEFTLDRIFDGENGWYPESVFPDDPRTIEEQIDAGRDYGPACASKAREMMRAALAGKPAPDVLRTALRNLLDLLDSLDDYKLTRDLPTHEAEAIMEGAVSEARKLLNDSPEA